MRLKKHPWGRPLVISHLSKANHNLNFSEQIDSRFNDWIIVVLYFSLYHACLALVAEKGYISKNHKDTLNFIKRNYTEINKEELNLADQLYLSKEDIEFYAHLKEQRKNASYSTNTIFTNEKINELKKDTIQLVRKINSILE